MGDTLANFAAHMVEQRHEGHPHRRNLQLHTMTDKELASSSSPPKICLTGLALVQACDYSHAYEYTHAVRTVAQLTCARLYSAPELYKSSLND